MTHEDYMRMALDLAREAMEEGEVPVGCVIVWEDGRVVGRGRNRRETGKDALAHAELEAIRQANALLGGWRLHKATLYVTLEPCPMCTGAIINSRLVRVVYGAGDPRAGCCGSLIDLTALPFNHRPVLVPGVREAECAALLTEFFQNLRQRREKKRPPSVAEED